MFGSLAQLRDQARRHERAVATWDAMSATFPGRIDASVGGLTICSVGYRAKTCLGLNDRLSRRLNPAVPPPEWLLFDNNTEPDETFDEQDPRFTVVKPHSRDLDMGYEHALGIGALLSRVRTRFLLVLDPDCFLVMPDWIRLVTEHMDNHGLAFFGTPINPRRHNSYRYFPYMVCMFVDLAQIPIRDLCFVPDVWHLGTSVRYGLRRLLTRIPRAGYAFRWLLTEQWKTNGWRIKAQYGHGGVKFECVQPVWDVNDSIPPRSAKRLIHALTPAGVSPIPKQEHYCSAMGFSKMGAPDVAALGWEEFAWTGEPFAFHVGSVHGQVGRYEQCLKQVVDRFAHAHAAADGIAAAAITVRSRTDGSVENW